MLLPNSTASVRRASEYVPLCSDLKTNTRMIFCKSLRPRALWLPMWAKKSSWRDPRTDSRTANACALHHTASCHSKQHK